MQQTSLVQVQGILDWAQSAASAQGGYSHVPHTPLTYQITCSTTITTNIAHFNVMFAKLQQAQPSWLMHKQQCYQILQRYQNVHTLQADIWLVVNVPVLSEQITEVQPRVSTDGRLRTIAFFLAMRRVPSARQVVITAGSPSGMAATANATAILK